MIMAIVMIIIITVIRNIRRVLNMSIRKTDDQIELGRQP
jgi:hypothetical protein